MMELGVECGFSTRKSSTTYTVIVPLDPLEQGLDQFPEVLLTKIRLGYGSCDVVLAKGIAEHITEVFSTDQSLRGNQVVNLKFEGIRHTTGHL